MSPRLRSRLNLTGGLALVGSWGLYSQAKGLHELDIVGGERTWTVQRAAQTTAGLEWRPSEAMRVRTQAYHRVVTEPWARRLNIELGFEIVPEIDDDDLFIAPPRSRADGVDIEIEGRAGQRLQWRAGYTLSRVEDQLQGRWIPRTYDQRHAIALDAAWQPTERWSVSSAWQWHTGWPIAEPDFVHYAVQSGRVIPTYNYLQLGESRLPTYHRLDIRLRHNLPLAGGTLGLSLDLINVLNRTNVRGLSYDGVLRRDGSFTIRRNPLTMAPLVPVVGVSWSY